MPNGWKRLQRLFRAITLLQEVKPDSRELAIRPQSQRGSSGLTSSRHRHAVPRNARWARSPGKPSSQGNLPHSSRTSSTFGFSESSHTSAFDFHSYQTQGLQSCKLEMKERQQNSGFISVFGKII